MSGMLACVLGFCVLACVGCVAFWFFSFSVLCGFVVGCLALICAAHSFMSCVYCSVDGGLKSIPTVVARSAKPTPTAPAIFLFFGSMSLSKKIKASKGKNAMTVMIAPS